jgi:hypothetical protein
MKEEFKLIGLNKKKNGAYATVECGTEDWFHSDFDESKVSVEAQNSLWRMFKFSEENLWKAGRHTVTVQFDGWSSGYVPINPIIIDVNVIL